MKDRFKFRAYFKDNNHSKMVYDIQNMCNFKDWITQEHIDPVMQSTGLKDKNGKLIYEGDIVKNFHLSSTMQPRKLIGEVIYDKERCYWCIDAGHTVTTFLDTDDSFEIIGNVYENPELLK